ncbi:hypothetical protein OS493_013332 [Desmophyllum pertusum]|uniref:Uncharacterized protein n=1 Tax=Desmophyllum pertusum TaxID=174260 RepID=A0A9W9YDG0_9CNID|nr:hypothetical protein OS493_013332 [Desmophyllum pertusum]
MRPLSLGECPCQKLSGNKGEATEAETERHDRGEEVFGKAREAYLKQQAAWEDEQYLHQKQAEDDRTATNRSMVLNGETHAVPARPMVVLSHSGRTTTTPQRHSTRERCRFLQDLLQPQDYWTELPAITKLAKATKGL